MRSPPNEQVKAGKIANAAIRLAKELCLGGIDGQQLDREIETFIRDAGATPALKGYHPSFSTKPYEWTICLSLDEGVVHGVPLKPVDPTQIITVDLVVECDGWHADTARTFTHSEDLLKRKFVTDSIVIFETAKKMVTPLGFINLFSAIVEAGVKLQNFGIITEYCGHGIGKEIHSSPQIHNSIDNGKNMFEVGQAYAVEPVLAIRPNYLLNHDHEDGFSVSADCLVSHNEDTLFIGSGGVINLTGNQYE